LIIPFGLGFGAVHALTPGHAQMLLASYVAGSDIKTQGSIRVASGLSVTREQRSALCSGSRGVCRHYRFQNDIGPVDLRFLKLIAQAGPKQSVLT
jgi:hypothetical protein